MKEKAQKCFDDLDFQSYLDRDIPSSRIAEIENHIKNCPRCFEESEKFRALFSELNSTLAPDSKDDLPPTEISKLMRDFEIEDIPANSPPSKFSFLKFFSPQFALSLAFCVTFLALIFYYSNPEFRQVDLVTDIQSQQIQKTVYIYSLLAPPGVNLLCVENPASISSTMGVLESGLNYKVPSEGKLMVSFGGIRMEFTKNANFQVNTSGIALISGKIFYQRLTGRKGWSPLVSTPMGTVTALGTKFSVEVEKSFVMVTLEHGKIGLKTKFSEKVLVDRGTLFMLPDGEIRETLNAPGTSETRKKEFPPDAPVTPPVDSGSVPSTLSTSY